MTDTPDIRHDHLPTAPQKVVRAFESDATEGPCGGCGLNVVPGRPDPCLGYLPGVRNACCGHGKHRAYIQFENGIVIRGTFDKVEYH